MRKTAVIALVTTSYAMLVGILLLIVVALTTALADGWKARAAASARIDRSPQFSPDGSQVAFIRSDGGPGRLWVMGSDGTDQRPLARATRFSWAGRGTLLLFRRDGRLFRIDAAGGEAVRARGSLRPTASGGRGLVVRDHRIYVRDADGSLRELT